jgi:hypothetical protein
VRYDYHSEKHRRDCRRDRKFLALMRTAPPEALRVIEHNHSKPDAPTWKVRAIERALARWGLAPT